MIFLLVQNAQSQSFPSNKQGDKRVWKLATIEWPPHTCSECPDGGIGLKFLREIFERSGEKLEVSFLPLKRALKGFKAGDFDLIYPLWIWDYKELGMKSKDHPVYHSPILMITNSTSNGPFCLVANYNYGPKIEKVIKPGMAVNRSANTDDQCIKLLESGRSSGTLVDQVYLERKSNRGFKVKKYQLSTYDQGDIYLGHQPRYHGHISTLLDKNLSPYRESIQKEFEAYLKAEDKKGPL